MDRTAAKNRAYSVIGFSFISAYLLSFLFEGQVLYSLLKPSEASAAPYVLAAIAAHFAGLFTCGFFIKSPATARHAMLGGGGLCLIAAVPFFFHAPPLWIAGLAAGGFSGGGAVAAWGYFLKVHTPKEERIKTCADVLISSNVIMIAINMAARLSPAGGLPLSMLCLIIGIIFIAALPAGAAGTAAGKARSRSHHGINTSLGWLGLFVFIITINSGLMYQVFNPAFDHLSGLVSWYWALPYIAALVIMRNLPARVKRANILYAGMAMIAGAFIGFMLLGRSAGDYLVVDTLMLGACGIFDLFWWSILGEMLEYTDNPAGIFGIGLSFNVLGVLIGDILGVGITAIHLPRAEVAVIALTMICITLVLLPPLNRQLVMLLRSHTYLSVYDRMEPAQRADLTWRTKSLQELTAREREVLQQILTGQSNREIGEVLFISESTVKTHIRNIFFKYDVGSRAELISTLLRNQTAPRSVTGDPVETDQSIPR